MNKSELFLKKIITENSIVIISVVLTAFLFHFALSAIPIEKKSRSLKSQQERISKAVVEAETERDLTIRGELLAKTIKQHKAEMMKNIASSALNLKIQEELQKHTRPEMLMNTFLKLIDRIRTTSKKKVDLNSQLSRSSQGLVESAGGAIAGTITVDGQAPNIAFPVFAFDSHGYFTGEANVDSTSGEYLITDLRAGSYYVITWSHNFVDEIYPDQLAAIGSLESWRNAQTVDVSAGITTPDINFDLQKGAVISGEITTADGTPITDTDVSFEITRASSSSIVLTKDALVVEKNYQITVPGDGEYKISAQGRGYVQAWYQDAVDWDHATPVTISASDSVIENINFTLAPGQSGSEIGIISGKLFDPDGGQNYGTMPVFAFNTVDTSFAGFGVALGFFGGNIEFYLTPGNYFLYARDITGGLIPPSSIGESYMGVYYPSTPSIHEAMTIPVTAFQTTILDSQFVLQHGGVITGQITGPEGEALDSLLVLSFPKLGKDDMQILDFAKLQISFGFTDSSGYYTLSGLPNGEYIIRTLSSFPLDSLNEQLGFYIFPPAIYADQFVDEYYDNIRNIFDLENATSVPVTVPNTTSGIDIQLDPVGYIRGRVTKSEDGTPIDDILILALNEPSGFPEFTMAEIDSLGDYVLGPMVTGSYKVLAVSGFQISHQHLTEFYDGAHIFQDADIVEVNAPQVTENINFTLDRGAIIQGFVDVDAGDDFYQAGVDTLDGVPVLIYHAESGKIASYDFVQFNGGFRVDRLLPGTYKVSVMPASNPFATTYAGGGVTFDDPLNTSVEIEFGDVTDTDIEIGIATGSISGRIIDQDTQQPISMAMVIVYDQTGHPVGAAMSDTDFTTGNMISMDGSYRIVGLRSGSYFLRTFALTSLLPLLESLSGLLDFDIMAIIANSVELLNLSLEAYADKWYPGIPDVPEVDVIDLLINFTRYGIPSERDQSLFPFYLPIPFYSPIPDEAPLVNVTDGAETADINFELKIVTLEDLIGTPVEEAISENAVPVKFALSRNYPNPFNPSTNFTYSLPKSGFVDLAVYDLLGRKVRTLVHKDVQAGAHSGSWDGRDKDSAAMPSGVYIIRLESQNYVQVIKATLIR